MLDQNKEVENKVVEGATIKFAEFVVLMALMMSLAALSIDAMLPALSIIGKDLGVENANDNPLIISFLFLGLGFGQLFYGPISDSTGRKKPLYWGLSIFLLGSLVCLFSTSLTMILAGRVIQGFGLASPRTVSLAMIRDQYEGREMARVISFVMMIFILIPVLAPAVGQGILLVSDNNWKAIFGFILLMALVILSWFSMRMHETLPLEKRVSFSFRRVFTSFIQICNNQKALSYTLTAGFVSAAFIGFLNSAQQIFQDQYELGTKFPLYFAAIASSVGLAFFFNSRMVMKHGMQVMVKGAISVLLLITLIFLLILANIEGTTPLWLFMVYIMLTLFCVGILFGNLNSLAMEPLGHIAGIGSAVVGSFSTIVSVFFGTIIGRQYNGTELPIVLGYLIFGTISLVLIIFAGRNAE